MTILYKYSNAGALIRWMVKREDSDTIKIAWGQVDGVIQEQFEKVKVNMSGRTLTEQIESRINSRINRQLDKGYCYTIEEAHASKGLNASKLLKPMLAQVYDREKHKLKGHLQYKYNGHRCLVHNNGDKLIAYSRNGKPITTIDHILKGIYIPEGTTLDGELYIHNTSLQSISSIVRREQPDNANLQYIIYDQIDSETFMDRYDSLFTYRYNESACIAELLDMPKTISNMYIEEEAIRFGYEGFILRSNDTVYEPGKRSKQLLKIKRCLDAEFIVMNIFSSKDGWGILECMDDEGKTFRVSAPGSMSEKADVLHNKDDYLGRYVTVEFAEYTKDGIPFHPVAIRFRSPE